MAIRPGLDPVPHQAGWYAGADVHVASHRLVAAGDHGVSAVAVTALVIVVSDSAHRRGVSTASLPGSPSAAM